MKINMVPKTYSKKLEDSDVTNMTFIPFFSDLAGDQFTETLLIGLDTTRVKGTQVH